MQDSSIEYQELSIYMEQDDKFRAGFTATFNIKRSDFMDVNSTKAFMPVPTVADSISNITAANNKTYGVWSASTADQMDLTLHAEFYKNH